MAGKLFVGPMTRNVVDAVLELVDETGIETAFIPSRRQVEFNSGYVNEWTTSSFVNYVDGRVPIQRDHSGPGQGVENYIDSYREDCRCEFDLIHIDPWKQFPGIEQAIAISTSMILDCLHKNPKCRFEVGTEEQIRKYSARELDTFLSGLRDALGDKFNTIEYAVVQSGTIVRALGNTGSFNAYRSSNMCRTVKKYGLKAKEHNSDYLSVEDFKVRAQAGVDTFNIAPELGVIETRMVLNTLPEGQKARFINLCYESGKWKKWVDGQDTNLATIAEICGHYVFSSDAFIHMSKYLPDDFDTLVKDKIKERLTKIINEV